MTTRSVTTRGWLRRFHPRPNPTTRLAVCPPAGAGASFAFELSARLGPHLEVLAVQYPGRQDRLREPLVDDVVRLAEHVAEALEPFGDTPLALFGHSMGGRVAFEVARLLPGRGALRGLVVSASESPMSPRGHRLHTLPDEELLASLAAFDSDAIHLLSQPDLRELLLPTLRADLRASETYRYRQGPVLECPVLACVGRDDPTVRLAEVQRWAEVTRAFLGLEVFSGGHFYLTDCLNAVVQRLERVLGCIAEPRTFRGVRPLASPGD